MTVVTPIRVHPHTLPTEFVLFDWTYPPYEPCLAWYEADKLYVINPLSMTGLNHRDPVTGFDTGVAAGYFSWLPPGTRCGGDTPRRTSSMRYRITFKHVPNPRKTGGNTVCVSDMIWLLKTGHWPKAGLCVDHIYDNSLCNADFNLQLLTRAQNCTAWRHDEKAWLEAMYKAGYDWFPRPAPKPRRKAAKRATPGIGHNSGATELLDAA